MGFEWTWACAAGASAAGSAIMAKIASPLVCMSYITLRLNCFDNFLFEERQAEFLLGSAEAFEALQLD